MKQNGLISPTTLIEQENLINSQVYTKNLTPLVSRKYELVWHKVIVFTVLHLGSLYGIYLAFTSAKILTVMFAYVVFTWGMLGLTAGAHRLWAHRAYKAKLPLRILLAICQTFAFQLSVIKWTRDHRSHHKFSDTDADPHNANRGFFFSHMGWQVVRKHEAVFEKSKTIDFSDLYADPVLRFQNKYYYHMIVVFFFLIPLITPMYFWNESLVNSLFICIFLRYCYNLHVTWTINSVAHVWGTKPFDKTIRAGENPIVSWFTLGEAWHNYHHTFPWDYKASELGIYALNSTTVFINFCALLGLAYDLKSVSMETVKKRMKRTGNSGNMIWGWEDKDVPKEDREDTLIT